MQITKSWIMTEEYMETITFDEQIVKLFMEATDVEFDDWFQTPEQIAEEYSDELWEWAMEQYQNKDIKKLYEYADHQEPVGGEVHEYRFDKN